MRPSSSEIQPFTGIPFSRETIETGPIKDEDSEDPFTYFSDFHTRLKVEIPVRITASTLDENGQVCNNKLDNLSRSFELLVHIPPIYLITKKSKEARGAFMASFGAHASLLGNNSSLIAGATTLQPDSLGKNLGYANQLFSIGYIREIGGTRDKYGTLVSWMNYNLSASQGSQVLYSFSHRTPDQSWITDVEFANPWSVVVRRRQNHPSSGLFALRTTHEVIPQTLYTFAQVHILHPIQPSSWNVGLGLSTVLPSQMNHSLVPSSSSSFTQSTYSSFLPQVQLSLSSNDYHPVLQCKMQQNFTMTSNHDDYYSIQFQFRVSPTRGLLDCSTLFSKTLSCFGKSHMSPFHTLQQGGLVCTIGLRSIQRSSMTWFIRLDHDDISFHIPLEFQCTDISSAINPFWTGQNLFMILLDSVRLWFCSHLIQRVLDSSIIHGNEHQKMLQKENHRLSHSTATATGKSLRDSLNQVESMKRRATMVRSKEEENRGLVIDKAWYYVDGCSCPIMDKVPCHIDVTIPVQFWVQESQLVLAPGSKQYLLGFCSLNVECPTCKTLSTGDHVPQLSPIQSISRRWIKWIRNDAWNPSEPYVSTKLHGPRVLLSIQYHFNGLLYCKTFHDEDQVILP